MQAHLVWEAEVHLHPAVDVKGDHPTVHQTHVHLLQLIGQLAPLQDQAEWIEHRVLRLGLHVVEDGADGLGLGGQVLAPLLLMANGHNEFLGQGMVAVDGWVDDVGTQGEDDIHCVDPVTLGLPWWWQLQQQKTRSVAYKINKDELCLSVCLSVKSMNDLMLDPLNLLRWHLV